MAGKWKGDWRTQKWNKKREKLTCDGYGIRDGVIREEERVDIRTGGDGSVEGVILHALGFVLFFDTWVDEPNVNSGVVRGRGIRGVLPAQDLEVAEAQAESLRAQRVHNHSGPRVRRFLGFGHCPFFSFFKWLR